MASPRRKARGSSAKRRPPIAGASTPVEAAVRPPAEALPAAGDGDATGSAAEPGSLYVVSTPIGNLGDLTFRAVDVLRSVDIVLAEDTRQSRVLLDRHGIGTRTIPLHEHNEARSVESLVARLKAGASAAIVSDAGTPLVSDPGERLVRAVWNAGLRVVPVPGASAVMAALAGAGVPTVPFTFMGFLPRAGRARARALHDLSVIPHTSVIYESPARVARTLADLAELGSGEREVVVARELTKRFEEFRRGTVDSLATYYASSPPRGEVVIVLKGRPEVRPDDIQLLEYVRQLRNGGATAREIMTALVREHAIARNLAWRLAHDGDDANRASPE